ncbi:hypothetical protein AVEN_145710-1 [Araneus ventricosus]|uniref:Uncharacterized protein n=1 Tax=Araneus ventricosus TaxID=182803 RepID=A0A4Y2JET8_ARAVE|nr:hypothetical protein AVEN_145710-1 [Araneus ventricosus]
MTSASSHTIKSVRLNNQSRHLHLFFCLLLYPPTLPMEVVLMESSHSHTCSVGKVLAAVRTLDRFGISDRAGAIVSATLQNVGIISESNVLMLLTEIKFGVGEQRQEPLLSQSVMAKN